MIEGYYLESSDGLFFAVKGLIHPPHRVVAYLRYSPDPEGDRQKGNLRYRRLYQFEEQEVWLKQRYPAYLFFDPILGEWLQGVPKARIKEVYDPCLKLAELRCRGCLGPLEEKTLEFVDLLSNRAQAPDRSLGVSGSILVGLHTPGSDLDIVVYGTAHGRAVHRALRELRHEPQSGVRSLNEAEMRQLYVARSRDTPMGFEDFIRLEERKVIQGRFRGCEYFIRFVRTAAEIGETYGDRTYAPLGQVEMEATVADAKEAIFTPCTYRIEDVRFSAASPSLRPLLRSLPDEIVSYRGRFCEQAWEGERITARGKLERVIGQDGKVHHRLLLGGQGDFMIGQVR